MDFLELEACPIVSTPENEENMRDMAAEFASVQEFFDPKPELYYKEPVSIEDMLRDDYTIPTDGDTDIDIEKLLAELFDPTVLDSPEFQQILASLERPKATLPTKVEVTFGNTMIKLYTDQETGMIVADMTGDHDRIVEKLSVFELMTILSYPFTQHGTYYRKNIPRRRNKRNYVLIPSRDPDAYEISSTLNIHWTTHFPSYEMRLVRHDCTYRMDNFIYLPSSLRKNVSVSTLTNLIRSLVPMQSVLFDLPVEEVASVSECKGDKTVSICNVLRILTNYSLYNWKKLLTVL